LVAIKPSSLRRDPPWPGPDLLNRLSAFQFSKRMGGPPDRFEVDDVAATAISRQSADDRS
jgi:hypothetical protein